MTANPYAHSRTEAEFDEPTYSESQNGYASPMLSDAPYNDTFGWAPSLRLGVESTPDASRLGLQPRRDLYVKPEMPTEDPNNLDQRRDSNREQRESVTHTTVMPTEDPSAPGYPDPRYGANRWARNPREIPPPEPRITQRLNPVMRFFTRPFGTDTAKVGTRHLNGVHFSMADHRRDYEILGMAPAKTRRNTFRLEPSPWDTDIVDMPPPDNTPDVAPVPGVNVAMPSRSFRLGA